MWKEETTDLADTILRIIRHAEINKGNEKDTANNINVLAVGAQQERAPWGICTNQEYIDQKSIVYYNDRCWIKHLELRTKYALKHIRTQGSNQNFRKPNKPESQDASTNQKAATTPEINS